MAVNVPVPEVDERLPVLTRHVLQAVAIELRQVADAPDEQRVHDRPRLLLRDADTPHLARESPHVAGESFLVHRGRHVKDVNISLVLNMLVVPVVVTANRL